jgi:hypothetical protein
MCLNTARLCAAALARARIYIHAPVQSVLDRPARADCLTDAFGVGSQATDIQALFMGRYMKQPNWRPKFTPISSLIPTFFDTPVRSSSGVHADRAA